MGVFVCVGIIPALAGNTVLYSLIGRLHTDHPRSRGEYILRLSTIVVIRGSSPLSRGIRHHTAALSDHNRIIPALAGNTQPMSA